MRTVAALVSAALLVVGLPAAAHAQRWTGDDPAGDVTGWHYDPTTEPCPTFTDIDGSADTNDDITNVSVRHGGKLVEVTVGFLDLDPTLEQNVSIHFGTTLKRGWSVDVIRFRPRPSKPFRVMTFMSREPNFPDPEDLDPCGSWGYMSSGVCGSEHAVVDTDLDLVQISVPRRCLRNPPWVRVGVTSSGYTYGADDTFSGFNDEWGTPEPGASTWLPPFSPPVPAAPGAQNGSPSNRSRVTNSSTELRRSFVSTLTGFPRGTTAATAY